MGILSTIKNLFKKKQRPCDCGQVPGCKNDPYGAITRRGEGWYKEGGQPCGRLEKIREFRREAGKIVDREMERSRKERELVLDLHKRTDRSVYDCAVALNRCHGDLVNATVFLASYDGPFSGSRSGGSVCPSNDISSFSSGDCSGGSSGGGSSDD